MARYIVSPPTGGFSCEHGSASPGEDGTFEIDNGLVIQAMRDHGLSVVEVPAASMKGSGVVGGGSTDGGATRPLTDAEKRAAAKAEAAERKAREAAEKAAAEAAEAAAKEAAGKPPTDGDGAALEAAMAAALRGSDTTTGA